MSTKQKNNVVKNDAVQALNSAVNKQKIVPKKKLVRKARVISASRQKPAKPVSFRLSESELKALKANANLIGKRSLSHVMRLAIQAYVTKSGSVQVPASLGVVDGIYSATIHDDVVELANQLCDLEFLLFNAMKSLNQSPETEQLLLQMEDARALLDRIAGCAARREAKKCS